METTLVVMAAGMGSRFGGLKQAEPVTADGKGILDFSVYDAKKAGFSKVVFIIREDMADDFKELVGNRIAKSIAVEYVMQDMSVLPEGRTKPFGTAHAIYCCKDTVKEPFAIINADDYYGSNAFFEIQKHLSEAGKGDWAMTAYHLGKTLSKNGTVSRGVCLADEESYLVKVEEHKKIERKDDGIIINTFDDGSVCTLTDDTTVSMNCFGFTPSFCNNLYDMFVDFLNANKADLSKCEFFLPTCVQNLIDDGSADVKIIGSDAVWQGVTNKEDSEIFRNFMRSEKEAGVYPKYLWEVR